MLDAVKDNHTAVSMRTVVKTMKMDEVRPELVTGKDILSPEGRLMLKKGTKLSWRLIEQLKQLGIGSVFIETEEELSDIGAQELEERMREVDALVERKFRQASPDNRLMMGLKEVIGDYLKETVTRSSHR